MKMGNELKNKRWDLSELMDEYEELSETRARLTSITDQVKTDRKLAKLGDAVLKLQDEVDFLEKAHAAAEIERARPLARQATKECAELFEREIEALDELLAAWQSVWAKTEVLHETALASREQWLVARDACWKIGEQPPAIPNFEAGTMTDICDLKNSYQAKFTAAHTFCVDKIQTHERIQGKQTHRQERRHSLSIAVSGSR